MRLQLKNLTRQKPPGQAGEEWKFVRPAGEKGKETVAILAPH